jgi:hypothetical protein
MLSHYSPERLGNIRTSSLTLGTLQSDAAIKAFSDDVQVARSWCDFRKLGTNILTKIAHARFSSIVSAGVPSRSRTSLNAIENLRTTS